MKKFISLLLCGLMVISLTIASVSPVFAAETASITVDGKAPVSINVGDVFEYVFCLNASQEKIVNGEAKTTYTSECLELIEEYAYDSTNKEYSVDAYMFPLTYTKSLVYNTAYTGQILFNFTAARGAAFFDNDNCIFIRAKFRVTDSGDGEISTGIKYMQDTTGEKIFNNWVPKSQSIKMIGNTSKGRTFMIGDSNASSSITVSDATEIQLFVAQKQVSKTFDKIAADANRDGSLSITDATQLQLSIANKTVPKYYRIGGWDFVIPE
ncbi:MAG: hypothetical protein KBS62_03915 [Oscillospiraceae bacterium]|nr:hypothetical protein [Candidatus Ruminococcus equi]